MNAPTPWRDADRIRDIAAAPLTPYRAPRSSLLAQIVRALRGAM